ncbi:50S ribosomal protein P1 [Candidatus Pacearchaeota archaeon]|nr:50S ribosomal protein P1 [Candidatus Pacearchaeota archaeon]
MEYTYGALLLHKLGKDVNEENLKSVVAAAGGEVDEAKVKSLIASLKGVNIAKELESASLVAAAPSAEAPKEEKKPEAKPKEEKKEAAAEGLSALFG